MCGLSGRSIGNSLRRDLSYRRRECAGFIGAAIGRAARDGPSFRPLARTSHESQSSRCRVPGAALCTVGARVLADDANLIRQSSEAFVKAFDQGDAKAVAALWTEDGQLVDEAGQAFNGRPAIEAAYAKFFQEHPGAKISVTVDAVRVLNDDAAIEEGRASLEPASAGAAGAAKYTAVHVKEDGKWQMASVYESSATAPAATNNLDSLDWLVGQWSGEERGATANVVCRWLPNKTFPAPQVFGHGGR